MAEESAIPFVTILVLFIVSRNSKLSFSKSFSYLCNFVVFTRESSIIRGVIPAWQDGASCFSHTLWSLPCRLCGQPPFHLNINWWSLTPVMDVVGFSTLLPASSVGSRFRRCSRNCYLDWGRVMLIFTVSLLSELCLRTAVKSSSTFEYTTHRVPYTQFPFRSWWKFLFVSSICLTTGKHFGYSPTEEGVHLARRAMEMSTQLTRSTAASASGSCFMVSNFQPQKFNQVWPDVLIF
jgi:hypothetical protein